MTKTRCVVQMVDDAMMAQALTTFTDITGCEPDVASEFLQVRRVSPVRKLKQPLQTLEIADPTLH